MNSFQAPHRASGAPNSLANVQADAVKSDANWGSVIPSAQLLHGQPVLHIEHNGALYQLRATRLGKLILTK